MQTEGGKQQEYASATITMHTDHRHFIVHTSVHQSNLVLSSKNIKKKKCLKQYSNLDNALTLKSQLFL